MNGFDTFDLGVFRIGSMIIQKLCSKSILVLNIINHPLQIKISKLHKVIITFSSDFHYQLNITANNSMDGKLTVVLQGSKGNTDAISLTP